MTRFYRLGAAAVLVLSFGAANADMVRQRDKSAPVVFEPNFIRVCPDGAYLVGFSGKADGLIRQLRIVCARWNAPTERAGKHFIGDERPVGRDGFDGYAMSAVCDEGRIIDGKYYYAVVYDPTGSLPAVRSIRFVCRSPREAELKVVIFGSDVRPDERREFEEQRCPQGQLPTGIEGVAERFIDRLLFICGPQPAAFIEGTVSGADTQIYVAPDSGPATTRRKGPYTEE